MSESRFPARIELRATNPQKRLWAAAAKKDGRRSLGSWIRAACNAHAGRQHAEGVRK